MSRTDVHAPAWVKSRDPRWGPEFREYHEHLRYYNALARRWVCAQGLRCDLDVYMSAPNVRTRCRMEYIGPRNIFCGCRMCTGHDDRKLSRRRERAALRGWRRRALALVDRADVDGGELQEKHNW